MQVVTTLIMVAYLSVITGLVALVYFRRMLAIVTAENIELKTELASLEKELEYLQNKQKQSKGTVKKRRFQVCGKLTASIYRKLLFKEVLGAAH